MKLKLNRTWELGDRIGGGGFGQVFVAAAETGEAAAIKLIPKAPGAEREMLFVDLTDVRNIVPIIDHGEHEDSWALVMPRAEKSLREYLDETVGPLSITEAVVVLTDIATTLTDLDGRVVHRDLKPHNVLLLDGHWCLADFGISRYTEATTAPDTQKYAMTPAYAAPERWRSERATIATDVYSLGIIAHELLTSSLPFAGPSIADFRDQHLHADPPPLPGIPSALSSLVDECLYKPPGARPRPANLLARLARAADAPASQGIAKLQQANRAEAARRGISARQASERRSKEEYRAALRKAALKTLANISAELQNVIAGAAPLAEFDTMPPIGWRALLSKAELRLRSPQITNVKDWVPGPATPFDVLMYTALTLTIPANLSGYTGRSHSLWYCDAQELNRYQWFEMAFMDSPLAPRARGLCPFNMDPNNEAAQALAPGIAPVQVAWPFTPLVPGDLDDFVAQWAGWFADAAQGQLRYPSSMPERPTNGSWRKN